MVPGPHERVRRREWEKLEYHDPAEVLRRLRTFEPEVAASDLPDEVKSLRTHDQEGFKEGREAALFCHGLSVEVVLSTVYYAVFEDSDFDIVTVWEKDGERHYTPVQLKEVPPAERNPRASIEETLLKLQKYRGPNDLVVAVFLNRRMGRVNLSDIQVPPLSIGGLWLFGAASEDGDEWFLYGDVLKDRQPYRFSYPEGDS